MIYLARMPVMRSRPSFQNVLMLENVRFDAEENLTLNGPDAAKTILINRLALMADIFINDAFGTAHRSQPTMVGLPEVMPSAAGFLVWMR